MRSSTAVFRQSASMTGKPDLARLAARQLAGLLDGVAPGASLPVESSSELCFTLEYLIPQWLRRTYPEWERESIDGFFFSSAIKNDHASAELAGTCILISDQTVTPFAMELTLANGEAFRGSRIRLGEPGGGPLAISGPPCTSPAAKEVHSALNGRLDHIDWVYEMAV